MPEAAGILAPQFFIGKYVHAVEWLAVKIGVQQSTTFRDIDALGAV